MRKLLLLLLIVLVAAIALYRQKLFLRDPLGKMYVNEVPVEDAKVFINFTNDVLIMKGDGTIAPSIIVQNWDQIPGQPQQITCVRTLACLTSDEHAPKLVLIGPADSHAIMSNREVSYRDRSGSSVRIVIR